MEPITTSNEHEYCSVGPNSELDHNRNTIIIENDQYISPLLSENFGSANLTEEAIYEEIDKIKEKLGFSEDDCTYAEILDNNSSEEQSPNRKSPNRTLR